MQSFGVVIEVRALWFSCEFMVESASVKFCGCYWLSVVPVFIAVASTVSSVVYDILLRTVPKTATPPTIPVASRRGVES